MTKIQMVLKGLFNKPFTRVTDLVALCCIQGERPGQRKALTLAVDVDPHETAGAYPRFRLGRVSNVFNQRSALAYRDKLPDGRTRYRSVERVSGETGKHWVLADTRNRVKYGDLIRFYPIPRPDKVGVELDRGLARFSQKYKNDPRVLDASTPAGQFMTDMLRGEHSLRNSGGLPPDMYVMDDRPPAMDMAATTEDMVEAAMRGEPLAFEVADRDLEIVWVKGSDARGTRMIAARDLYGHDRPYVFPNSAEIFVAPGQRVAAGIRIARTIGASNGVFDAETRRSLILQQNMQIFDAESGVWNQISVRDWFQQRTQAFFRPEIETLGLMYPEVSKGWFLQKNVQEVNPSRIFVPSATQTFEFEINSPLDNLVFPMGPFLQFDLREAFATFGAPDPELEPLRRRRHQVSPKETPGKVAEAAMA